MRDEYSTALRGAKALRKVLHERFGGHFETALDEYPGGLSIVVTWSGGPTPVEVWPLARAFQQESPPGAAALYETRDTPFTRRHGGAKFVMLRRTDGEG